jgi:hypothetical protein
MRKDELTDGSSWYVSSFHQTATTDSASAIRLGEIHFNPSGPSSVCHLPRENGVAYAAQEAWVMNETIRVSNDGMIPWCLMLIRGQAKHHLSNTI